MVLITYRLFACHELLNHIGRFLTIQDLAKFSCISSAICMMLSTSQSWYKHLESVSSPHITIPKDPYVAKLTLVALMHRDHGFVIRSVMEMRPSRFIFPYKQNTPGVYVILQVYKMQGCIVPELTSYDVLVPFVLRSEIIRRWRRPISAYSSNRHVVYRRDGRVIVIIADPSIIETVLGSRLYDILTKFT